ncbi:P-loop containing nucleoside triphosphate hydrolase protein [Dioscorea alata]|uniref:P-loop containing nucleoside triphosphate hydrolase protein n=1 Tax=Dioscorea alata TaxID=55571 RepID=A0ACB7WG91_DIOAL|nr:P-loop containing nucleoside triphosphate hydrolase protein [Dioscorea alata]
MSSHTRTYAQVSNKMAFHFSAKNREEEEEKTYKKYDQFILTLPEYTIKHARSSATQDLKYRQYRQYQGFWFSPYGMLQGIMAAQAHFIPRASDILICTPLKVGTTWLKALAFATLNRNDQPGKQSLLLSHNPHHCVLNLEFNLYGSNRMTDLTVGTSARLLSTHIPCQLFPTSWLSSGCKFVYLCRNPKDTFISYWHFVNKIMKDVNYKVPLGDAFDAFLKGVHLAGPLWDHVFGFWNASLVNPDKVLFMKYEELRSDTAVNLKKLAEFMGCPFTEEEERDGVLEKILDMCSFESLRNLEVNKNGIASTTVKFGNEAFFRKGEVGDWVNFLTPEMAERLDHAMEQKLKGSGLSFKP